MNLNLWETVQCMRLISSLDLIRLVQIAYRAKEISAKRAAWFLGVSEQQVRRLLDEPTP